MPSTYKEKLLEEINEFPDETIFKLYRIIHILGAELTPKTKRGGIRGSLKGIWRGTRIDAKLFPEAKKSLFLYETR